MRTSWVLAELVKIPEKSGVLMRDKIPGIYGRFHTDISAPIDPLQILALEGMHKGPAAVRQIGFAAPRPKNAVGAQRNNQRRRAGGEREDVYKRQAMWGFVRGTM